MTRLSNYRSWFTVDLLKGRSDKDRLGMGRPDRFRSRESRAYFDLLKSRRTAFVNSFLCTFRKYVYDFLSFSPGTPSYDRSRCTCIQISAFSNLPAYLKAGHHYISRKNENWQEINELARIPTAVQGKKQGFHGIRQPIINLTYRRTKEMVLPDVLRNIWSG